MRENMHACITAPEPFNINHSAHSHEASRRNAEPDLQSDI
ncbi:hypothetical protein BIFGAL_04460 [Bifidobacterium gallicum DSM 20093 = LMG 11596]|uniref:Uncharacterized protein n=1 Tax=Bifidobacterium gallicum DSM 20093 = LMG 11596 TaxID=561180 RepID=D1NX52_9BIFI|nr:hypothetical protein BIFGAL_04460 [Bifidobacterium gallicum DSM 20093 = LMG 11596]